VAYGSLLKPRRKALHELVGRAIEELYADRLDERVAQLAHHFAQGEVWGGGATPIAGRSMRCMGRSRGFPVPS
jgi:hypothetical protein